MAQRIGSATGGDWPLEPTPAQMRALVDAAMERIIAHVESLPDQPANGSFGGAALARSLREPPPMHGRPLAEALDLVFERAAPVSFNTAGPGYLAYIPGGGLFHTAVANLIADSLNRFVGLFQAAPGLSQLEANVVHWFAELMGYPPEARGFLTSGGSLANFGAIVTARRTRLPERFLDGTIYASDQSHHSVRKAAMLAGFPPANVRCIDSDDRFRIRLDRLEAAIAADRREGLDPFLVVGNAGSTNTGAVDPLPDLADLAARERLWFHVDAAYGGFFALTERGRRALAGIERSDSLVLDPHKGMFLPYGTGALLVRDGEALRRAHAVDAEYLPPMQEDSDLVDFCQYSPELSRPYRGLRVWLPIALHGFDAFERQLDEKLDLTRWIADELRARPEIEIVAEPELSLFAFTLRTPGMDVGRANTVNRAFMGKINSRQRIYVTGTMLRGRFAIRICVLSFRTHMDRMREAASIIAEAARAMTSPSSERRMECT